MFSELLKFQNLLLSFKAHVLPKFHQQQLPIIVIKIQHCHCDLYITLWKKFSTLPIWLEFSPGYPSTTKLRDIASISKYTS